MIVPNENAVGIYAAALVISGFIYLIPVSINNFVKPYIRQLTLSGELDKLQNKLNFCSGINLLLIVIVAASFIFFSTALLSHFGSTYVSARTPLIILVFAAAVSSATTICNSLLAVTGNEGSLLIAVLLQFAITLFGGIVLTYFYGILGAASVVLIVAIFKAIVITTLVKKRLKLKPLLII